MNISELLQQSVNETYHATAGLVGLVDDDRLGWKPESGDNWMTTGQLLAHIQTACGLIARCFVTGDWSVIGKLEADLERIDMFHALGVRIAQLTYNGRNRVGDGRPGPVWTVALAA